MFKLIRTLAMTLLCAFVVALVAQERAHVKVETVAPRAADVATIDGIIKAFYEVISGPAGQPRQWERDRSLYIPGVRFVEMSEDKNGKPDAEIVDHQQFVDRSDPPLVKNGFFENEIRSEERRVGKECRSRWS